MSEAGSWVYEGRVVHRRRRPLDHRLAYRVFALLLDLDDLLRLDARLRLFAYNRPGLTSFCDRDHGDGSGSPLRAWAEAQLRGAGIDLTGGRIQVLCYPRIMGYGFNPLSVYYCHWPDGRLAALIHEVSNTFGQRHCYLIPVELPASDAAALGGAVHQECDKRFYVSPFIAVGGRYRFRLSSPGRGLAIAITHEDAHGPLLHAAFRGQRRPLDDRRLASVLLRYPLLTLKVIGGIYWEALRLWLKGMPVVPRPSPPVDPVSIVSQRT